jgi:hypothetical protein
MSYLAQGLQSGFGAGFSAGTQRKRDNKLEAERKARDAIEDEFRLAQIAQQAREFKAAEALREHRVSMDGRRLALDEQQITSTEARDRRDFDFKKGAYADSRSDRAGDVAREDRLLPLKEQNLVEQARQLKLQNDALANPKPRPMQAVERLEYDPYSPDSPPKRIITGPAGGLGEFSGSAKPDAAATMSAQDRSAFQWAKANPDDPRAAAILQRLGVAK